MAQEDTIGTWATIYDDNPGGGNSIAEVTTIAHTGRDKRTGYVVVSQGQLSRTVNIAQIGTPEYVTITSIGTPTASASSITIEGKSNAKALTFVIRDASVTAPTTYTVTYDATSVTVNNGAAITDDPGANQEYTFSASISVPANTAITQRIFYVYVTASETSDSRMVTQPAGSSYIHFAGSGDPTEKTISFNYHGLVPSNNAKYVDVALYSNDDWRVESESRLWFSLDTHGNTSQNGTATIGDLLSYTGRSNRESGVKFTTYHDANAVLTVQQTGKPAFIELLRFEDEEGNTVTQLGSGEARYYIVGKSNCQQLSVEETTATECTSLNTPEDAPHTGGFILTDASGVVHGSIALDTTISPDYGGSGEYTFKIPFYSTENNTEGSRKISVELSSDPDGASREIEIWQQPAIDSDTSGNEPAQETSE